VADESIDMTEKDEQPATDPDLVEDGPDRAESVAPETLLG
jgi:hypothetical protein